MSDRQLRRPAADFLEAPRGAAVQLQLRWPAGTTDDLDVAPEDALRVAGAEGFHRGFFRGEAAGKVNRRVASPHAIRDFAFGEDAVCEALAVPFDGGGDSWNVGGVESEADDGEAGHVSTA